MEQKSLAMLAERVDGMIHLQRRFRRQPGSESEDALRLKLLGLLRHQKRGIAGDLRTIIAGRPRDQDLRLRKQQRAETVGLGLQLRDLGAQPRLPLGRTNPRTHQ